jgi:hypothetical protein
LFSSLAKKPGSAFTARHPDGSGPPSPVRRRNNSRYSVFTGSDGCCRSPKPSPTRSTTPGCAFDRPGHGRNPVGGRSDAGQSEPGRHRKRWGSRVGRGAACANKRAGLSDSDRSMCTGRAALVSAFLGEKNRQRNRQCIGIRGFYCDVPALSRLKHGFESRWGHHFNFVGVFRSVFEEFRKVPQTWNPFTASRASRSGLKSPFESRRVLALPAPRRTTRRA